MSDNIDMINHPPHYAGETVTIECIDITRHLPFSLGNAVKYTWRVGKKGRSLHEQEEDLRKAIWYIRDWIAYPVNFDFSAAYAIASLVIAQCGVCRKSIVLRMIFTRDRLSRLIAHLEDEADAITRLVAYQEEEGE